MRWSAIVSIVRCSGSDFYDYRQYYYLGPRLLPPVYSRASVKEHRIYSEGKLGGDAGGDDGSRRRVGLSLLRFAGSLHDGIGTCLVYSLACNAARLDLGLAPSSTFRIGLLGGAAT